MQNTPQRRFLKHLGHKVMYSDDGHSAYKFDNLTSRIVKTAHFFHLPRNVFQYIGIDLDWEGAGNLWIDEGYPEPTIVIITNKSAHAKYLYELTEPVYINFGSNLKPYNFYRNVCRGLTNTMAGDQGYTGKTINNPFYKSNSSHLNHLFDGITFDGWKVHWADVRYDLSYLSEFCRFANTRRFNFDKSNLTDNSSRHMTLFNHVRTESYCYVKQFTCYEKFLNYVQEISYSHWLNIRNIEKDHPLTESEAMDIARSVSKWVWQRRNEKWMKKFQWDLGILKLDRINLETMSFDEVNQERNARKSKGAKYTHQKRRSMTEARILHSIDKLVSSGMPVSMKDISNLSGISLPTMYRYKHLLYELDI